MAWLFPITRGGKQLIGTDLGLARTFSSAIDTSSPVFVVIPNGIRDVDIGQTAANLSLLQFFVNVWRQSMRYLSRCVI